MRNQASRYEIWSNGDEFIIAFETVANNASILIIISNAYISFLLVNKPLFLSMIENLYRIWWFSTFIVAVIRSHTRHSELALLAHLHSWNTFILIIFRASSTKWHALSTVAWADIYFTASADYNFRAKMYTHQFITSQSAATLQNI